DLDHAPRFLEVDLGLVPLELTLDDVADLFRLDHVLSPCEPLAQTRELPVETAVQDEAADLRDEAAQQRGVDLLFQDDALAERTLELARQLALFSVREGDRRSHLGASAAELGVHEPPVGPDDLGQMIGPAALGH